MVGIRDTCARRFATIILLAGTVLLGGCGSMSHDDYQRELRSIGSSIARSLDAVPRGSNELDASQLEQLAKDLRENADDLDGLNAPSDAESAQKELVHGLRDAADVMGRLGRRLDRADTGTEKADLYVAFSSDKTADRAFSSIQHAQDVYAKHGYRVFTSKDSAR